ncbi:DUF892 family protein [Paraburkholderia sp. RL17-337-BIB-A]
MRRLSVDGSCQLLRRLSQRPKKVEHYEIAAYGSLIALAKQLGETESVRLLGDASIDTAGSGHAGHTGCALELSCATTGSGCRRCQFITSGRQS